MKKPATPMCKVKFTKKPGKDAPVGWGASVTMDGAYRFDEVAAVELLLMGTKTLAEVEKFLKKHFPDSPLLA